MKVIMTFEIPDEDWASFKSPTHLCNFVVRDSLAEYAAHRKYTLDYMRGRYPEQSGDFLDRKFKSIEERKKIVRLLIDSIDTMKSCD